MLPYASETAIFNLSPPEKGTTGPFRPYKRTGVTLVRSVRLSPYPGFSVRLVHSESVGL